MSIQRFKPEIWSALLLSALRKALVYGGPMVVNKDYEGEISQAGDTVRITSISDPTINDYIPGVTVINPEQLTDAQRTLVIDQSKYFAFEVDDVDARQAAGNVLPEAASRAAYKLADTIDQYIASFYTGANVANTLGTSGSPITVDTVNSPQDAYNKVLVPLRTRMTKANIPTQGRYAIVSPDLYAGLLLDNRFIKVNESGDGGDALRNGHVGRAAGFEIFESNNVPSPTGGVVAVSAGVQSAISYAEQINKTEAYRPQSSFADAIKGLNLYGAKLVRPEALAIANVAVS